ncbi:unnamed protein product [Brassica oleracea]
MLLIDEQVRYLGANKCRFDYGNSPVSYVCSSFKPPLVASSNIVSHRCINEIKCKK